MLSRTSSVLFLCVASSTTGCGGKIQNSATKQVTKPNSQAGQSFVVNNNCGLAKAEREMMAHIKAKVDYLAEHSRKGSISTIGWVRFGASLFLVIDIPMLEWKDGRRNCQKFGADLAKITSAAENQFVYNLVNKQKKINRNGVWLGLHRKTDTKFYWADGTPLTGYMPWAPGEPNNPSTEKCAHMYNEPSGKTRGRWNDIICTWKNTDIPYAPAVLCQKHLK